MSRFSRFIVLCVMLMLTGCTSILTRSFMRTVAPPPPLYFGGVRGDCAMISQALHGTSSDNPWLSIPYSVIDFPFSLGADILLLPYDIYTDCRFSYGTKHPAH